jgi:hypothetical protein
LIGTLRADTGPSLPDLSRTAAEIDAVVAAEKQSSADYDFVAPDGIQHTVWRIPTPSDAAGTGSGVCASCRPAYLATGITAPASAARGGPRCARERGIHSGLPIGSYACFFRARQLRILALQPVA